MQDLLEAILVYLLKEAYEILVIDSFINSSFKSLEKVQEIIKNENKDWHGKLTIIRDIRDKDVLDNIFLNARNQNKPIDAVLHFAD